MLEELALSGQQLLRTILTHCKPSTGEQYAEFVQLKIKDFCLVKDTKKVLTVWITDLEKIYKINAD